jgi:phosphoglycerate dehydrogenase-like enzyme
MVLGIKVVATPSNNGELTGVQTVELKELLTGADVISVHVDKARGQGVLDSGAIRAIRSGRVLVNAAFKHAIDNDTLIERVVAGEIRAAVDYPLAAPGSPVGSIISSNGQTAFNTVEANARISARSAKSLLNLLRTGDDSDLVNPEYRIHAKALA